MAEQPQAFVYDAIRTPRGKGKKNGSLHEVKPVDLVVGLLDEIRERNPGLDPDRVDDVVLGVVTPDRRPGRRHRQDRRARRRATRRRSAGVQLNRFCASGLEAVNLAAQQVRSGCEDLILAGGVESMSRVPMGSDGGAWAMDPRPRSTPSFVPQGIGADLIATLEGFSRDDVDAFAAESQARAAKAQANGYFDRSVVPVKRPQRPDRARPRRVHPPRHDASRAWPGSSRRFAQIGDQGGFDAVALEKYHWVEKIDHVHHAGNSSRHRRRRRARRDRHRAGRRRRSGSPRGPGSLADRGRPAPTRRSC